MKWSKAIRGRIKEKKKWQDNSDRVGLIGQKLSGRADESVVSLEGRNSRVL